jgi:hypothetical protein
MLVHKRAYGTPFHKISSTILAYQLVVRRTHSSTLGDQSFLVAGLRLLNTLPQLVSSVSSSFPVFKSRLEMLFFRPRFLKETLEMPNYDSLPTNPIHTLPYR